MKKAALIIFILGFILSGSFAQQNKDAVYGDDVYYSPSKNKKKDRNKDKSKVTTESSDPTQQVAEPDSTSSALPKSSTLFDDYNDYAYSARIKRFHDSEKDATYFDETYTDPSNYDSTYPEETSSPDVNLYFGAGFGSFYGPSFSFGLGWGCDPWYWNSGWGWGYPYFDWFWGYNYWWYNPYPYYWNSYSYGYWNGYNAGYWDGYYGNPYGWNSWDYPYGSNTFYGRRQPITSTGSHNLKARTTEVMANTPTGKDGRTNSNLLLPTAERTTSTKTALPAAQQKYQYTRNQKEQPPSSTKNTSQYSRLKEQPIPKYIKPEQTQSTQTTTRTQSYTPPTYRQPKSSQEYLSPRTKPSGNSVQQQTRTGPSNTTKPPSVQTQRQNTIPSGTNKQNPGSTGTQMKNNKTPTRDYTPVQSTPTRSNNYSSPSRSNSNSSPSRSSGYSSPSRSSSPSSSSPSRSSGSAGGGRFGGGRK